MATIKFTPKWNGSKEGYVDPSGAWAIDPAFDEADFFDDHDMARVRVGENWGWIDTRGAWVIKPRFTEARDFFENRAAVVVYGERWSYIDREGRRITDLTFADARDFSCGLAAVLVGDEWGYIDLDGKMAIKPMLEEAGSFRHTGLYAPATLDGREGWIDPSGSWRKDLPGKH